VVCLLAIVGCGTSVQQPRLAPRAEAEPCDGDPTRVTDRFTQYVSVSLAVDDAPGADFGADLRRIPELEITRAGEVFFHRTSYGPFDQPDTWQRLTADLDVMRRNWSVLYYPPEEWGHAVSVLASRHRPVTDLVRVATLNGVSTLDVWVRPTTVNAPGWARSAIEASDRDAIEAAIGRATGGCEGTEDLSGVLRAHRTRLSLPADEQARAVERQEALVEALGHCRCDEIDIDALIALVDNEQFGGNPVFRRIGVGFAEDGHELVLPASATVGDLVAALADLDDAQRRSLHLVTESAVPEADPP